MRQGGSPPSPLPLSCFLLPPLHPHRLFLSLSLSLSVCLCFCLCVSLSVSLSLSQHKGWRRSQPVTERQGGRKGGRRGGGQGATPGTHRTDSDVFHAQVYLGQRARPSAPTALVPILSHKLSTSDPPPGQRPGQQDIGPPALRACRARPPADRRRQDAKPAKSDRQLVAHRHTSCTAASP